MVCRFELKTIFYIALMKRRLAAARLKTRAMWAGDDGTIRGGHSGDVVQMLEDMKIGSVL